VQAFYKSGNNIIKADFDILYKNILRKHDSSTMDFYAFLDAVESLANRVYKGESLKDSIG
jgi:hypothetical protein